MKLPLIRQIHVLKNGLKVILIQKEGFSKSLFMIGVPAGGTNQIDLVDQKTIKHRSGCAHFLEHQMFRLNGEDVTYPLAQVQAKCNAATSYEDTCYFVYTHGDPYPPLRLLIEFVQTLEITPETVEKEKGIILSEYLQYDQDPESRLQLETFRSLYHFNPLRQDILGTPQDIQEMQVKDLQDFYKTWYDPSQLVLVGISGHDPNALFSYIEKLEENFPSQVDHQAKKYIPIEPREVARPFFSTQMDIGLTYACLGVKLDPLSQENSVTEMIKKDYMLNLWLNATFGAFSKNWQSWLDTHLIGISGGCEADIDFQHAYILIYAQTERPEEYLNTMKQLLEKKPPLSPEVFESLLIQEKASTIRLLDRFESLAQISIDGSFLNYDPIDDLDVLNSITLDDLNTYISTLDFSAQSQTVITPLHKEVEEE